MHVFSLEKLGKKIKSQKNIKKTRKNIKKTRKNIKKSRKNRGGSPCF
jgi:hypothetical protein